MKGLKVGDHIKFKAMDTFTCKEIILLGNIIGDYEAVKKQYPEEMAEASEGVFLVETIHNKRLYVINVSEALERLSNDKENLEGGQ